MESESAGELTENERELFKFIAETAAADRQDAIFRIIAVILNSSNVRLSALGLMWAADLTAVTGCSVAEMARRFELSRSAIYEAGKEWKEILEELREYPERSIDCVLERHGWTRVYRKKVANFWREVLALPKDIAGQEGAKDLGLQRGSKKTNKTKSGGKCRAGASAKNKKYE
jgi:hypothetical protein